MCRRRPAAAPAAQPVVPGAEGAEEAAKPAAAAASAEEAAGALSRASFWWVVPFFRAACAEVAASGELSLESLPPVPQAEAPSAVIARLGGLVEEELRAKRPSMHRAVWRFCRGTLVQQVLVCVVYTLLSMASPALVRPLMQAIRGEISRDYGFAAVLAMTASGIVSAVLQQLSFHAFTRLGRQVWLAFVGHLFEKPARLDAATFSHSFTEGQVISMIGQDAPQFPYMAPFFSIFISAPLMIMVGGALIFAFLKEAFLSGCVVCTLAMFISERASAKYKAIVAQKLLAADERMLLVNEALQGMRYIKLCAWESSIEERVAEVRVREMRLLRRAHMCYAFQQTVVASLPVLATVATLVTHAALGRAFETGDVLMALGCFELMATGFLILPNAFMYTKTFHVSIARMGRLVAHAETYAPRPRAGPEPGLALEDASFQWDLAAGEPSLAGVSLRVGRGRLVAVVGRVAAGKTTLASGALGLARRTSGKARLCGRCAYVPQSPQILNATLRDNVLFGAEPDEERYLRALRSCCLERDVAQFADRDLTEIGERGITISGGQRARVALARALFSNPDVVILDDPLSAMDPHVGRTVFQECILKDMRGRGCAVLFLTNQLQFCQAADSILVLDRGRVVEEGSFEELRDAGGVFTELFATAASTSEACKAAQAPQSGTSPGGLPDGCWCLAMPRLRACRGAGIARGKDADAAESAARSVPLDNGQEIHGGPELAATPATPGLKKTWSMSQEAIIRGRIGVREFLLIARTGDSSCLGTLLLAFCILAPLFMYGTSLSLSRWITAGGSEPLSRRGELQLYLAAGGLYAASSGGRTVSAALYFTRVAEKLHARMMGAVLRQTMAWYDTTPMGRVLNRCSQDLALLDLQLPRLFEFTMQHTGGLVVGFVGTALLVWPSLLVILPLSWAVWELFRKYGTVSLDLQRLMLVCTSPVMSRVSSFLTALDTIRAFGKEGFFEADFRRSLSDFVRVYYWIHAVDRLVMISAALLCIPALTLLLGAGTLLLSGAGVVSGDLGGLALALSCGLSLRFPLWIWCASTTEKFLGGAQRVREYAELPWEGGPRDRAAWAAGGPGPAAGAAPAGAAEAEAWPARGTLELEDVHVRYQAGLPLVLRGLSLKVRPGERVGVCGRTGSGKSTLFLACFRMAELERGRLLVEGRDAREVPLPVLRARLAIVPQDPLMFSGTLRSNLDLRGRFADAAVWEALRLACLEDQVRGLARGLDEPVQEKGGNFSAGTVQLLCIARILLNSSAVGLLFLDECTASVDYETDALVQAAVRRAFSGCSIICIAHRIQTILDYDKIAFLDAGQLAEYGSPQELLRKPGGLFADLARGTRDGGQHSAKSGLQQAQAAGTAAVVFVGLEMIGGIWAVVGVLELLTATAVGCSGVVVFACTVFVASRFAVIAGLSCILCCVGGEAQEASAPLPELARPAPPPKARRPSSRSRVPKEAARSAQPAAAGAAGAPARPRPPRSTPLPSRGHELHKQMASDHSDLLERLAGFEERGRRGGR